jgi:uncharacterized protein YqjF (DUF2071 family)
VETPQGIGEFLLRPAAAVSPTFRQAELLSETDHRPWPMPDGPWFMRQTWSNLMFAHWRVSMEALNRVVPPQLPIDAFDGSAWLGVTPFLVSGLRLRGTTPVPLVSRFPELNVRTYVTVDGRPGIYFLSLDAARRSAVFAARRTYRLPYFHARMSLISDGRVDFCCERSSRDGPMAAFRASYRPQDAASTADPGSLEHFLAERYCLYTLDEGRRVHRGEIQHPPWPLQPAEAQLAKNTMTAPFGIHLEGEPLLHFAQRQDVLLWAIQPI